MSSMFRMCCCSRPFMKSETIMLRSRMQFSSVATSSYRIRFLLVSRDNNSRLRYLDTHPLNQLCIRTAVFDIANIGTSLSSRPLSSSSIYNTSVQFIPLPLSLPLLPLTLPLPIVMTHYSLPLPLLIIITINITITITQ